MKSSKSLKIKCIILLATILSLSLFAFGCGRKEKKSAESPTYNGFLVLVDSSGLSLVQVDYDITVSGTESEVRELIDALKEERSDYLSPLSAVNLIGWDIEDGNLLMYFDSTYYNLGTTEEALIRCAVVKSLCQIDGVDSVAFFVDDVELSLGGNVVGPMNDDSFFDALTLNEGTTVLDLYFPDKEMTGLVKTEREIEYNPVYTDEQMIVEEILKGPLSSETGITYAVPEGTKLLNIVTKDMVCYVNLSSEFLDYSDEVTDVYTVYSIVNSLCQMSGISSVVIMVEDENLEYYNTCPTGSLLVFNYDLVLSDD